LSKWDLRSVVDMYQILRSIGYDKDHCYELFLLTINECYAFYVESWQEKFPYDSSNQATN